VSDNLLSSLPVVPLLVAVSGHRDLVPNEIEGIRKSVRDFFKNLQNEFPGRPLQLLSPLAEGADQLAAEEALALGISLVCILPMSLDRYLESFSSPDALASFHAIYDRADAVYTLSMPSYTEHPDLHTKYSINQAAYAELAIYLCKHCHILLAIWDGKMVDDIGGTSQAVYFHHNDVMPGYMPSATITQQLLAEDDSDLVFHVVVSRHRPDGLPEKNLKALTCSWFTADKETPRTHQLPLKYIKMFKATNDFNLDIQKHYAAIASSAEVLMKPEEGVSARLFCEKVNTYFNCADWLAMYYQKKLRIAMKIIHVLCFFMGLMFLFYTTLSVNPVFMWVFAVCLLGVMTINKAIAQRGWQRKYLEYRTLAESLRIQFFWISAGIISMPVSKFAFDNYRMKQDPDLSWIRNVSKYATLGCDISIEQNADSIQHVIKEWLGDESNHGQLEYYRKRYDRYVQESKNLELSGVVIGWIVSLLLLMTLLANSGDLRAVMFLLLGTLMLAYSVRQAYSYKSAERELVREFKFMLTIFSNARHRLNQAKNDEERLKILQLLGESALDEHAGWILRHLERPLDQGDLFRMGM